MSLWRCVVWDDSGFHLTPNPRPNPGLCHSQSSHVHNNLCRKFWFFRSSFEANHPLALHIIIATPYMWVMCGGSCVGGGGSCVGGHVLGVMCWGWGVMQMGVSVGDKLTIFSCVGIAEWQDLYGEDPQVQTAYELLTDSHQLRELVLHASRLLPYPHHQHTLLLNKVLPPHMLQTLTPTLVRLLQHLQLLPLYSEWKWEMKGLR